MTAESLNADIDVARSEFHAINQPRLKVLVHPITGRAHLVACAPLPLAQEQRICELADRIQRLCRFRNELQAREYSKGAGDWLTPEQAQEKSG